MLMTAVWFSVCLKVIIRAIWDIMLMQGFQFRTSRPGFAVAWTSTTYLPRFVVWLNNYKMKQTMLLFCLYRQMDIYSGADVFFTQNIELSTVHGNDFICNSKPYSGASFCMVCLVEFCFYLWKISC